MIDAGCVEENNNSKIKCADGRSHVVFINEEREVHIKIRVDGCVVTEGERADWVLEKSDTAIIIELKGRDVEHGAKQVIATAKLWKGMEVRCRRFAGLIVSRQYPKASTSIQRKQDEFAKMFKGPLHVITHNPEVIFANVASFKGPFKR